MTCLVKFPSKRALREHIEKYGAERTHIEDPSITSPYSGSLAQYLAKEPNGAFITNHPERSWFAHITRENDGTLRVK